MNAKVNMRVIKSGHRNSTTLNFWFIAKIIFGIPAFVLTVWGLIELVQRYCKVEEVNDIAYGWN